MAAGEWLSFQGVQGFEPPQANDWISGLDPTYQLWLSQRKPEMNILAWANAIKQVCAQLIKLRRLDDDGLEMGEPLLSKRIDVLDISRICHVCRHESHPQPALEWPATAAEGIETILDAAGSARYLYAEAEGFNSTWTLDSERGDVVILYETVPEIRRVRTD